MDRNEIFKSAWQLEGIFHGSSSGVDPACCTFGGLLLCSKSKGPQPVDIPGFKDLDFMLIDTKIQRSTKQVNKRLLETLEVQPELEHNFDKIDDLVGDLLAGELALQTAIRKNEVYLEELGLLHPDSLQLMDLCHQRGFVAKITGAGLGGCVLVCSLKLIGQDFKDEVNRHGFSIIPINMFSMAEGVTIHNESE